MAPTWLAAVPGFALIFARCAGALLLLPPWNWRTVPLIVRLGLASAVAVALAPLLAPTITPPEQMWPLVACIITELIVGLAIGLVGILIFWGLLIAGQLLEIYISGGSAMRTTTQPIGPLTHLYYLLGLVIFIGIGGHRWLLQQLYASFSVLPAGTTLSAAILTTSITTAAGQMFLIGLVIAAPAITALFLADVALATVARSVPQIPWDCAVPALRWPAAIIALLVTAPLLSDFVGWQFQTIQTSFQTLLGGS